MELRAHSVVDVVPISTVHVLSLLHQNNIGVTYIRTSNFRMELVRSMPLYYVVMPQYVIIVIEVPLISTPIHIVDGVKSIPQTPRGTKFVSLHEDIPKEVNNFFAKSPIRFRGGGSNPP